MKLDLDFDEAEKLLSYDAQTGVLRWKVSPSNGVGAGDVAGTTCQPDYLRVQYRRRKYFAHRLAWLLHYGEPPSSGIDHIDGDKSNNRIENLRLASTSENLQNTTVRKNNTSGRPGVSWFKPAGMWRARIVLLNKEHHLGYFHCLEDAAEAYVSAKKRLHTFSPTVRVV